MKNTIVTSLVLTSLVSLSACSMGSSAMRGDDMGASASASASADSNPMVGGAAMYRTRDIVDNAVNSADHTTLVAAVKAAGLVPTLKGAGPFTVFAPTNAAFDRLPAGTVDSLLKPSSKAMLTSVLTYHVVPGRIGSAELASRIRAGGGSTMLTTAQGESLTARMQGNGIVVMDSKGNMAHVTTADVVQSNGVIHVIDTVLMP